MAVDLSHYHFPFGLDELSGRDRAVLAMVIGGSDEQRAAVAGDVSPSDAQEAREVAAFIARLDVREPDVAFASSVERARYLARAAAEKVETAFPGLHAEVVRRAGNRYAFLNR